MLEIHRQIERYRDRLTLAVVVPKGNGFEFVGSGFILQYRDRHFFISAKHVIEEIKGSPGSKAVRLFSHKNDHLFCIFKHTEAFNFHSLLDLAAAEINNEKLSVLDQKFIDQIKIDESLIGDVSGIENHLMFVTGFPVSQNKVFNSEIKSKPWAIELMFDSNNIPEEILQSAEYIFLQLRKKGYKGMDGGFINIPSIQGMSGGPLWSTPQSTLDEVKLTGMLFEYHEKKKRTVICHSIVAILSELDGLIGA